MKRYAIALSGLGMVSLLLTGPVTWAHPDGHWHLTRQQIFEHALELQRNGHRQMADRMISQLARVGYRPAQYADYQKGRNGDGAGIDDRLLKVSGPLDATEQFRVAEMWLRGDGVPEDPARAVFWFRLAADQGHAMAQIMLASQLDRGDGVMADGTEAGRWLESAARSGSSEAQFRLGHRLGGEPGRRWIEKAAGQGHSHAQQYLGLQLAQGGGYATDEAAALAWLIRAADGGEVTSMLLAGMMLSEGRGSEVNDQQAYYWLKRAQLAGDPRADAPLNAMLGRLDTNDTITAMTGALAKVIPDPLADNDFEWPVTQLLGHGTGFWLNDQGHLLTNYHVIDQCAEVRVPGAGVVERVAFEPQNDIAVLKVAADSGHETDHWLSISPNPVAISWPVRAFTVSHPDTEFEQVFTHSGRVRALQRPGFDGRYFRFDARLEEGASGGPVVDENGQVVGLVVAKLTPPAAYRLTGEAGQPVSFALRSELIRGFLAIYGIATESASPETDPDTAVVRVECWY